MEYLVGLLAPDGIWTECESWTHLDTAQEICDKFYNKEFIFGYQAENFLYDKGYVIFSARGVSHKSIMNDGTIVLLSQEQKDFIINNLSKANNNDQRESIIEMLKLDDDLREDSFISVIENKYL